MAIYVVWSDAHGEYGSYDESGRFWPEPKDTGDNGGCYAESAPPPPDHQAYLWAQVNKRHKELYGD